MGIESDGSATLEASINSNLHPSSGYAPNGGSDWQQYNFNVDGCEEGEIGNYILWEDVPEGDWDIGISSTDYDSRLTGGRYKVSVQCLNSPFAPEADELANTNITTFFYEPEDKNLENRWKALGSDKISCGSSAMVSTL